MHNDLTITHSQQYGYVVQIRPPKCIIWHAYASGDPLHFCLTVAVWHSPGLHGLAWTIIKFVGFLAEKMQTLKGVLNLLLSCLFLGVMKSDKAFLHKDKHVEP